MSVSPVCHLVQASGDHGSRLSGMNRGLKARSANQKLRPPICRPSRGNHSAASMAEISAPNTARWVAARPNGSATPAGEP